MNKLAQIQQKCKCSISITINRHKNYYQTIQEGIDDANQILNSSGCEPLSKQMVNKMIEHNTIIDLQFYPNTPVGSYSIYHYDLEKALDEALEILKQDGK